MAAQKNTRNGAILGAVRNKFTVPSRQISLLILNPAGGEKVAQRGTGPAGFRFPRLAITASDSHLLKRYPSTKCRKMDLFGRHFQDHVHLGTVVELAKRLGVALRAFVLGVDLVVNGRRKGRKAIGSVLAYDVRSNGTCAGICNVNHGVGECVVLRIKDLTEKQATRAFIFLALGIGYGESRKNQSAKQRNSHHPEAIVTHISVLSHEARTASQ